jgi:hypothetical protein
MVEAGRIRAGDTGPTGRPRKLDKWRLTSKDRVRLQAAAVLWGGEVKEWEGRDGEYELYTDTAELPIMLLPETEPSLYYEMWTRGGCQRRCDGQHELLSDSPCLCGEDRECKPHLRFPVLLPDLKGIGSWLVQSTGWNAANEIPGAVSLLTRATAQGVLIPARLRLEQRVEVKGGQTHRFAVPVIDVDISFRDLLGTQAALLGGETASREQAALPAGYIPIEARPGNGTSLAEGLATAETQQLRKKPRVELPDDDPDDDTGASATPQAPPLGATAGDAPATHEENIAALNALVTSLSESGTVTKRQVWVAVARMRSKPVDDMIDLYDGKGDDGEVHWSPLRQILRPEEAVELRKRLGAKWAEMRVPA